jgi:hypothetical protein
VAGWWFSPVSSTNKTNHHDITKILLKMGLSTITLTLQNVFRLQDKYMNIYCFGHCLNILYRNWSAYMENKTFKSMVYSFRIKFVMYKWLTETKLNMNVLWMYHKVILCILESKMATILHDMAWLNIGPHLKKMCETTKLIKHKQHMHDHCVVLYIRVDDKDYKYSRWPSPQDKRSIVVQ